MVVSEVEEMRLKMIPEVAGHSRQYVENIDAVRDVIEKNRRITIESLADTLSISVGSAHVILVESLGLSKLSARWVPKLLRSDQKQTRADLSMEILNKWD